MSAFPANQPRRILVVDDNEDILAEFQEILGAADRTEEFDAVESAISKKRPARTDDWQSGDRNSAAPLDPLEFDLTLVRQGPLALAATERAVANERSFDVAFVDMRMPSGWGGTETIEQLWCADPELQIVVCAAYTDQSWHDLIARFGHTDRLLVLRKPFDATEVRQLAIALSEKRRLGRRFLARLEKLDAEVAARKQELEEANARLQTEIVERRAAHAQLSHDSTHDQLTGLANRAFFLEQLGDCRTRHVVTETPYAILFLDLDNFKLINDSLGHTAGDELLIQVAERLRGCTRGPSSCDRGQSNTLARLGGDEFVVLLDGLCEPDDAIVVVERIRTAFKTPFWIGERSLVVTVSIGLKRGEGKAGDVGTMMRDADTAMYRAKMAGKNQYAVFDDAMHASERRWLEMENDLRRAIEREEFELHYQPIVALATGEVRSFEALLRWRRPGHGFVPPLDFVPIAEETGLIIPIGKWVLEEACRQIRVWNARNAGAIAVAVNVSGRQVMEPGFADHVRRVLDETRIDGRQLKIEVTETVIMGDADRSTATMRELRNMGVAIHMDDFGTGHSSLSCLHRFPIDVLKIDREFIRTTGINREYAAIVMAIVTLAHNLDIAVVAEGVETEGQLAQMHALECDFVQGFYFSRPLPAGEAGAFVGKTLGLRSAG